MGIKFNLVFNDIKIKNLEQLKDNFYIEDILLCYKNEKLIQWLEDKNLSNESEKIKEIDSNLSEFEIIKIITEVLEIEFSKIKIIKNSKDTEALTEDNSEILEYQEKIKNLQNELELKNSKIKSLEEEFILKEKSQKFIVPTINLLNYNNLKEEMKVNYKALKIIRSLVGEIETNYFTEFNQDYRLFFEEFKNLPFIILAVLMNKNLRAIFIQESKLVGYFNHIYHLYTNKSSDDYYYLSKYIIINNKKTEILEKIDCLILSIDLDTHLYTEENEPNKHYNKKDIDDKYLILRNFYIGLTGNNVYYVKMD